jgi:eukaryotic-like serine/threonine-protein kinase
VSQAQATLSHDGLKSTVQADPTSTAPNTQVIRTNPGSGTKVNHGSTVTLTTGNQGAQVKVPDLTNQSVQAATGQLQQLGLQVTVTTSASCLQQNIVCDQNPKGGQSVNPGATVTLTTAQQATTTTTTSPTVQVPNVVGLSESQACNILGQSGLQCSVTNSGAGGTVTSQNPNGFTQTNRGATVTLTLSGTTTTTTSATTTVTNVVGQPYASAQSTLHGQGFTTSTTNCGTIGHPNVLSQNPLGGTSAPTGSNVLLTC